MDDTLHPKEDYKPAPAPEISADAYHIVKCAREDAREAADRIIKHLWIIFVLCCCPLCWASCLRSSSSLRNYARFTFAHLARCAAAIRFLPTAEIVCFGLAVRCFAQRAFCARLIFRFPAADIVRDAPFELPLPKAASASSMRWSCFCASSRSFFNCWTT